MYKVYRKISEKFWLYSQRDERGNPVSRDKTKNPVIDVDINKGERVSIHLNLHEKPDKEIFSVKDGKTKILKGYSFLTDTLVLDNVEFEIDRAGQNQSLKTGSRNVHSFVTGDIVDIIKDFIPSQGLIQIKYLPPFIPGWEGREYFYNDPSNPDNIVEVSHADRCYLYRGKVYAEPKGLTIINV
jgi:hypothetical protein